MYEYDSDNYEYDYHDIVDDVDFIDDETYYDDGNDEPWMGMDYNDNEVMDNIGWENYYHNIADEIEDD